MTQKIELDLYMVMLFFLRSNLMMKVCFYLTQDILDWTIEKRKNFPILPIPGSLTKELSKENEISFLIKEGSEKKYKIDNKRYFASFDLMLEKVDVFISIGSSHLKLLKRNFSLKNQRLLRQKSLPIIYRNIEKGIHERSLKNRLILSLSRCQIYTSSKQYQYALENNIGKPIFLPIGIDLDFYYASKNKSKFLQKIINQKYIIMHGDEEREEDKLIKLASMLKIGIVRINQYPYKSKKNLFEIAKSYFDIPFIYNFQNIDFHNYIWLLKNSTIYAGMVNSKFQPAGWTALCEAIILGIPSIISNGITSDDYLKSIPKEIQNQFNLLITNNLNSDSEKIKCFLKDRVKTKKLPAAKGTLLDINKASEIFYTNLKSSLEIL